MHRLLEPVERELDRVVDPSLGPFDDGLSLLVPRFEDPFALGVDLLERCLQAFFFQCFGLFSGRFDDDVGPPSRLRDALLAIALRLGHHLFGLGFGVSYCL